MLSWCTYINSNGVNPLVILMFSEDYFQFTSDESMTKIVSGTYGRWEIARGNMGTIANPLFKSINRILSSYSCKVQ